MTQIYITLHIAYIPINFNVIVPHLRSRKLRAQNRAGALLLYRGYILYIIYYIYYMLYI